jgi:hypothetical protein
LPKGQVVVLSGVPEDKVLPFAYLSNNQGVAAFLTDDNTAEVLVEESPGLYGTDLTGQSWIKVPNQTAAKSISGHQMPDGEVEWGTVTVNGETLELNLAWEKGELGGVTQGEPYIRGVKTYVTDGKIPYTKTERTLNRDDVLDISKYERLMPAGKVNRDAVVIDGLPTGGDVGADLGR